MDIVFPENNSVVEREFTLNGQIGCYNSDDCLSISRYFYVCLEVEGAPRDCHYHMFDEMSVQLVSQNKKQMVTTSLCSDLYGCICNSSVIIECCKDSNSLEAEIAKIQDKLKFLEYMDRVLHNVVREVQFNDILLDFQSGGEESVTFIGIKSSSFNFWKRDLIRNTFLRYIRESEHFSHLFIVRFIVGDYKNAVKSAVLSPEDTQIIQNRLNELLVLERNLYNDVLFDDEIPVKDGYYTLTEKSLSFLKWVVITSGKLSVHVSYAVILDDDVYLNVDELFELLYRSSTSLLYAGRVFEDELQWKFRPIRTPKTHRNYLPESEFSGDVLPRYASGPTIILGYEVVKYLLFVTERLALPKVGTLEDVSVANWLNPNITSLLEITGRRFQYCSDEYNRAMANNSDIVTHALQNDCLIKLEPTHIPKCRDYDRLLLFTNVMKYADCKCPNNVCSGSPRLDSLWQYCEFSKVEALETPIVFSSVDPAVFYQIHEEMKTLSNLKRSLLQLQADEEEKKAVVIFPFIHVFEFKGTNSDFDIADRESTFSSELPVDIQLAYMFDSEFIKFAKEFSAIHTNWEVSVHTVTDADKMCVLVGNSLTAICTSSLHFVIADLLPGSFNVSFTYVVENNAVNLTKNHEYLRELYSVYVHTYNHTLNLSSTSSEIAYRHRLMHYRPKAGAIDEISTLLDVKSVREDVHNVLCDEICQENGPIVRFFEPVIMGNLNVTQPYVRWEAVDVQAESMERNFDSAVNVAVFFHKLSVHGANQRLAHLLQLQVEKFLMRNNVIFEAISTDKCIVTGGCDELESVIRNHFHTNLLLLPIFAFPDDMFLLFLLSMGDLERPGFDYPKLSCDIQNGASNECRAELYLRGLAACVFATQLEIEISYDGVDVSNLADSVVKSLIIIAKYNIIIAVNTFGEEDTAVFLALTKLWKSEYEFVRDYVCSLTDCPYVNNRKFPKIIFDLSNFPLPQEFVASTDVILAPSYYVAAHPSTLELNKPVIAYPPAYISPIYIKTFYDSFCALHDADIELMTGYKENGANNAFQILFIGRFDVSKSIGMLMKAVRLLTVRFRDEILQSKRMIKLTLVGSGELLDMVKRYIVLSQLNEAPFLDIEFLGNVYGTELMAVLLHADVLVNPIERGETYGIVHVEAAFLKVRVIAFDRRANVESMRVGNTTNVLLSELSANSMANALFELYSVRTNAESHKIQTICAEIHVRSVAAHGSEDWKLFTANHMRHNRYELAQSFINIMELVVRL